VTVEIRAISAADCHDLRRRILREGTPSDDVHFSRDDDPDTRHYGAFADGRLVGVATCFPSPTPLRLGAAAWQLRGMAVEGERQRAGAGRRLIDSVLAHVRDESGSVLWANARDSALGFYERVGFEVVGDGFVTDDTRLPHHVVVLDLA